MDRLKSIIQDYRRWSELSVYINRIETLIEIDFSNSLENAKALLETISKEICNENKVTLRTTDNINKVLKKAFASLDYPGSHMITQISSALATIGQQVGELRNMIGVTSHGRSLEEIKQRNSKVDLLTKEFLIDSVELICVFLIRNFEVKNQPTKPESLVDSLEYLEAEAFNKAWDDSFGEFVMGDYSYSASEVLFHVDKQAYVTEYKAFTEIEV